MKIKACFDEIKFSNYVLEIIHLSMETLTLKRVLLNLMYLYHFKQTEMKQPVRNVHCGHTYDKAAIEEHIKRMGHRAKCPIVGCPQVVKAQHLEIDRALARELKKRHK